MVSANIANLFETLDFNDPEVRDAVTQVMRTDPNLRRWFETRQGFYSTFQPRPDKPDEFDEQTAFMECDSTGVIFLIGGTGSGTTTCGLMKAIRFMLEKQAPPRKDTPFWIISNSYESTIKNAWKDKIAEKKMIPDCEIDKARISWYRATEGLPMSVPLKPWPTARGGHPDKNWCIEFKSYEQGREHLQARSIGGFLFMEQFPYDMLTEVLGRCRDYSFPGSKICEFTPIDPALSAEIEDMDVNGTLPSNWRIFRCNTELNSTLGEGWFGDFMGTVSDEMYETRRTGAWGNYEGCVYQSFNPQVHVIDFPRSVDKRLLFPAGVYHRRGMDWGASSEHPFAAVWAYRDGLGAYWVYDEYKNGSQSATIWDHAEVLNTKQDWPEGNPFYGQSYGDPSRPDMFNNFAQLGLGVSPARNDVLDGIETVRQKLKVSPSTKKPLLFIDRKNCPQLIAEMRRYRWYKSKTTGLNPNAAKFQPLKRNDDLVDALRYLIHTDASNCGSGVVGMHVALDPKRHGVLLAGTNGDRDRREKDRDREGWEQHSGGENGNGNGYANGNGNGNGHGGGKLTDRIRPRSK